MLQLKKWAAKALDLELDPKLDFRIVMLAHELAQAEEFADAARSETHAHLSDLSALMKTSADDRAQLKRAEAETRAEAAARAAADERVAAMARELAEMHARLDCLKDSAVDRLLGSETSNDDAAFSGDYTRHKLHSGKGAVNLSQDRARRASVGYGRSPASMAPPSPPPVMKNLGEDDDVDGVDVGIDGSVNGGVDPAAAESAAEPVAPDDNALVGRPASGEAVPLAHKAVPSEPRGTSVVSSFLNDGEGEHSFGSSFLVDSPRAFPSVASPRALKLRYGADLSPGRAGCRCVIA